MASVKFFAWCKKGTTKPIKIGQQRFFVTIKNAITTWKQKSDKTLTDFVLVTFTVSPNSSMLIRSCPVCCNQIIEDDQSMCLDCYWENKQGKLFASL